MIAATLTSLIIAGMLLYAIREIHAQTPRNTRRHFGV